MTYESSFNGFQLRGLATCCATISPTECEAVLAFHNHRPYFELRGQPVMHNTLGQSSIALSFDFGNDKISKMYNDSNEEIDLLRRRRFG